MAGFVLLGTEAYSSSITFHSNLLCTHGIYRRDDTSAPHLPPGELSTPTHNWFLGILSNDFSNPTTKVPKNMFQRTPRLAYQEKFPFSVPQGKLRAKNNKICPISALRCKYILTYNPKNIFTACECAPKTTALNIFSQLSFSVP